MEMTRQEEESFSEKIYRFRSFILIFFVPLLLISTVLCLRPLSTSVERLISVDGEVLRNYTNIFPASRRLASSFVGSKRYAVIFDAGSTGSRVHVYCFDENLNLVPIGEYLELFVQTKPGLSAYSSDPQRAAESLQFLLKQAENVVPQLLRHKTPVKVGATAGLRALKGDASDRILQAVRDFLKDKSDLKYKPEWVTVLEGTQEGAFQWATINYLLGNIGKKYSGTVGVIDLGGGSVQMSYAISEKSAAKAPIISDGKGTYVSELFLKGTKYHLYAHSYLQYGLLAARVEILKALKGSDNSCILKGYKGSYTYSGVVYNASASASGSSMNKCRRAVRNVLNVNGSTCAHKNCTFGGIWNGGGGDGQKNLFVASFFFDRALQAGFVDPNLPVAKVQPDDFEDAAKHACKTTLKDAKSMYPLVEEDDLPYLCMDLVYQFTLLVDGFGLHPRRNITLVKQVKYGNALVEAAWPLGSAIEVMSSST